MKFLLSILLLTFFLLLFSCKKENIKISTPVKIQIYVNNFFTEANKRDLKYVNKDVTFILTDNYDIRLIGDAGKSDLENQQILIDTTSDKYQYYPEVLIFHEMGHYFLFRPHRPGNFNNKNQDEISIMNPDAFINYNGSFSYKRQYYIDELFNINTTFPYWAYLPY